jgi:hypothetical protein
VPIATERSAAKSVLDHLVGDREHARRDGEPERSHLDVNGKRKHSSVPNFFWTGGPFFECYLGIVRHQSKMRNRSQFWDPRNLAVNEAVIEPDLRRLGSHIRVVNAPQSRPIDRAEHIGQGSQLV